MVRLGGSLNVGQGKHNNASDKTSLLVPTTETKDVTTSLSLSDHDIEIIQMWINNLSKSPQEMMALMLGINEEKRVFTQNEAAEKLGRKINSATAERSTAIRELRKTGTQNRNKTAETIIRKVLNVNTVSTGGDSNVDITEIYKARVSALNLADKITVVASTRKRGPKPETDPLDLMKEFKAEQGTKKRHPLKDGFTAVMGVSVSLQDAQKVEVWLNCLQDTDHQMMTLFLGVDDAAYSHDEIANEMGVSAATVESRISELLQQAFGRDDSDIAKFMLKCERLDADKRGDVFYKVARQFGKIKNIPKNAVSKPQVGNEDQQKTKSNAVVVDDGDLIPEDEDVQVFEEAKGHGSRAFNQDFFASGSSRKVTVEEDKDILRKRLAEQMRQFEARGGQVEVIECPLDKPDRRKHYRPAGHDLY